MATSQKQQIIPMDGALKDFEKHLKSHPRTILSARFGDGKSYFLSVAEKQLKQRYVFLKVYPVNYQVADNQDIFEYVKRDILFQLYGQGMIPDAYEIPDNIASYFFLKNNWDQFAEELLTELSLFDASNTIKATLGAAKFIKAMKQKYDEFKENGGEVGAKLDRFIASFDEKGIYEADPITTILCDIIKAWKKEHPRRKVCLVFEDMDRIDPNHIFRILNVISAQMDYAYKYGFSPKSNCLDVNKFGVDNIVLCLDYDNLKNIFYHFYGENACFEGYVHKFSDKGIFHYSLQEQVQQFYSQELVRITGMGIGAVNAVTEQISFSSFSLRQLYHAADGIGQQISLPSGSPGCIPHRGLYIVAAILWRLGYSAEEIISVLGSAFHKHPIEIGPYLATSMLLRRGNNSNRLDFSFGEKESGYLVRYEAEVDNSNEIASIRRQYYMSWDSREKPCDPKEEIAFILQYVNK